MLSTPQPPAPGKHSTVSAFRASMSSPCVVAWNQRLTHAMRPCTQILLACWLVYAHTHTHTQAMALTLSVNISSSLPPTSHRHRTTSRCPPSHAACRHVLPSCDCRLSEQATYTLCTRGVYGCYPLLSPPRRQTCTLSGSHEASFTILCRCRPSA